MRTRITAIAVLLGVLAFAPACPSDSAHHRFITDSQGRALVLHGLNVISAAKNAPLRVGPITRDDVRRYALDWGFNFVRFLIFWDAVEPAPEVYDAAYFERVEEQLDWMHEFGIQVVLDMHQDVYSEVFCCDGAPLWAVRANIDDFVQLPQWDLNYFTPEVMEAFDNFWDYDGPHGDLQRHYAAAWAHVVERLGDHPAVIGYDIMNEPAAGSHLDFLATIGVAGEAEAEAFDLAYLRPFYERVVAAIRKVDPDGWIFYEPRYAGPADGSRSFLGRIEDPREGEPRIVYFPHLYSIALDFSGGYVDSDDTIASWEASRSSEIAEQVGPLLIGEFGVSPTWSGWDRFLDETLAMADRSSSGWAYWSADPGGWGPSNPDGTESPIAGRLVRVYPQRVAGRPIRYGYDPATRVFELVFAEREGVEGPTEIYVPARRFYPDGFELDVDQGHWESSWDDEREVLSLGVVSGEGPWRVTLRPAAPAP